MDEERDFTRRELLVRAGMLAAAGAATSGAVGVFAGRAGAALAHGSGTTLDIWTNTSSSDYQKVYRLAGDRLSKKDPGVSVDFQRIATSDYETKIKTAVAGGVPPNLAQIPNTGVLADLVAADALLPLNTYRKTGFPTFRSSLLADLTSDGKLWAIPLDANTMSIGYNVNLFKKYGLKPPETQADLVEIAKTLKKHNVGAIGAPLAWGWVAADVFFAALAYTDPTDTALHLADRGKLSWTDKRFLKALKLVSVYAEAGLVPGPYIRNANPDLIGDFARGNLAMIYPVGNFSVAPLTKAIAGKFTWDAFPFPPPAKGIAPRATGGAAVYFSVFKSAPNTDVAVDYLRLATDKTGRVELDRYGFIPSAPSPLHLHPSRLDKQWLKFQKNPATRSLVNAKVTAAIQGGVQALFEGKATPASVVGSMAAAAKR